MFQLSAESSHYLNRTVKYLTRSTCWLLWLLLLGASPCDQPRSTPPPAPPPSRRSCRSAVEAAPRTPSAGASSSSVALAPRPAARARAVPPVRVPCVFPHIQRTILHIHRAPSSSDSTPSPDLAILVRGPRALLFPYPPALALARSRHSASPYALSASHDLDHRDEVDTPLMKRKLSRVKRNTTTASGRTAATSGTSSRAGGSTRSVWEREEVVLRLNAGAGVAVAVFLSQEAAVFPSLVVAAAKTVVCRSKTGQPGEESEDMVQDVQAFDEALGTTFDPSPTTTLAIPSSFFRLPASTAARRSWLFVQFWTPRNQYRSTKFQIKNTSSPRPTKHFLPC
ncbi:hypothetical protein C8J57DRAFT_1660143 [Mycena rebaudengoi]|nr:hypothetical protein C8J57DRAFT_1660143 [Mycena rebaudengoi]